MMQQVMTKASKHLGTVQPARATEYLVDIGTGRSSIQVFKEANGILVDGTKFAVGDVASYDSYNLTYLGVIDSITDKTVTIVKTRGANCVKHRLSMYEFCWRNFNLNAEKVHKENMEEMRYL